MPRKRRRRNPAHRFVWLVNATTRRDADAVVKRLRRAGIDSYRDDSKRDWGRGGFWAIMVGHGGIAKAERILGGSMKVS